MTVWLGFDQWQAPTAGRAENAGKHDGVAGTGKTRAGADDAPGPGVRRANHGLRLPLGCGVAVDRLGGQRGGFVHPQLMLSVVHHRARRDGKQGAADREPRRTAPPGGLRVTFWARNSRRGSPMARIGRGGTQDRIRAEVDLQPLGQVAAAVVLLRQVASAQGDHFVTGLDGRSPEGSAHKARSAGDENLHGGFWRLVRVVAGGDFSDSSTVARAAMGSWRRASVIGPIREGSRPCMVCRTAAK